MYKRPANSIKTSGDYLFKTKNKTYELESYLFERQGDTEDSLQIQDELRGELGSILIKNSSWSKLSKGDPVRAKSSKGNVSGVLVRAEMFKSGGGIGNDKMKVNITKNEFSIRKDEPNRVFHSYEGNIGDYTFTAETDSKGIYGINKGSIYQLYIYNEKSNIASYDNKWDYRSKNTKDGEIRSAIIKYIDSISDKKDGEAKTFSKGGNVIERRYVNKSEDYEVRYAKNKPKRTGYKSNTKFAKGGSVGKFKVGDDVKFNQDPSGRLGNNIYYGTILEINNGVAKISHQNSNMKDVIRNVNLSNLKEYAVGGGVDELNYGERGKKGYIEDSIKSNKRIIDLMQKYLDTDLEENSEKALSNRNKVREDMNKLKAEVLHLQDEISTYQGGGDVDSSLDILKAETIAYSIEKYGEPIDEETFMVSGLKKDGEDIKFRFVFAETVSGKDIKLTPEQLFDNDRATKFAKGGSIENQYKGKTPEKVWSEWSIEQKSHFLKDHFLTNTDYSEDKKEQVIETKYLNWDDLPRAVQMEVERHIFMKQYSGGGEIKDGFYKGKKVISELGTYSNIKDAENVAKENNDFFNETNQNLKAIAFSYNKKIGDRDIEIIKAIVVENEYAGGGEISKEKQEAIAKLQKLIDSDNPMITDAVKEKAKKKIEELSKVEEVEDSELKKHIDSLSLSKFVDDASYILSADYDKIEGRASSKEGRDKITVELINKIEKSDDYEKSVYLKEIGFKSKPTETKDSEIKVGQVYKINPKSKSIDNAGGLITITEIDGGNVTISYTEKGESKIDFISESMFNNLIKEGEYILSDGKKEKESEKIMFGKNTVHYVRRITLNNKNVEIGDKVILLEDVTDKDMLNNKRDVKIKISKSNKQILFPLSNLSREEVKKTIKKSDSVLKKTSTRMPVAKVDEIREKVISFLNPLGYSATVDDLKSEILIEPSTTKVGKNRKDFFDGMQINYDVKEGKYEVSEYQAGKNKDELHIYKVTPSLTIALKDLIKGNKRKPIKVWGGKEEDKKSIKKADSVLKKTSTRMPRVDKQKEKILGIEYTVGTKGHKDALARLKYVEDLNKSEISRVDKKETSSWKEKLASLKNKKGYKGNIKKLTKPVAGTKSRNIKRDLQKKALPMGKRISKDGNVYYENRANRSDVDPKENFGKGGEVKSSGWGINTNW